MKNLCYRQNKCWHSLFTEMFALTQILDKQKVILIFCFFWTLVLLNLKFLLFYQTNNNLKWKVRRIFKNDWNVIKLICRKKKSTLIEWLSHDSPSIWLMAPASVCLKPSPETIFLRFPRKSQFVWNFNRTRAHTSEIWFDAMLKQKLAHPSRSWSFSLRLEHLCSNRLYQ